MSIARRIGVRGRRFVQQPAKVDEMGMRRRPFFEFGRLPLSDELIGCHRGQALAFGRQNRRIRSVPDCRSIQIGKVGPDVKRAFRRFVGTGVASAARE